ncbi:unnamed protein product [Soboliphyme baturini]|uniref:EB domain-containing protein n=1 Tax=Soboliphyme baturini TaxID=241478 RepID=A0A183IJQ5_9BILA|nr:unnamed protein product [Soboliphyme baturini]
MHLSLVLLVLGCLFGEAVLYGISISSLVPLGHECTKPYVCRNAYALCIDGICKCRSGFEEVDGICSPLEYRCPFGEPLRNGNQVVECATTRSVGPTTGTVDDCPPGNKCFEHLHSEIDNGRQHGHCCPSFTLDLKVNACPVGEQHTNGTCPDLSKFPADFPIPVEARRTCPYGNHDCVGSACCPEPCPASNTFFEVKGLCYTRVFLNNECTMDGECYPNARCVQNGG